MQMESSADNALKRELSSTYTIMIALHTELR